MARSTSCCASTSGDEVLFTARDALAACTIALNLAATFTDHPIVPAVRVGYRDNDDTQAPRRRASALLVVPRCTRPLAAGSTRFRPPGYSAVAAHARPSSRGFESLLELVEVRRHLLARASAHHEWHEQLADPVAGEVELDRDSRPLTLGQGREGHIDNRAAGTVNPANAPRLGRID